MGCVYILKLEDGCFYVGYTERLEHRLKTHRVGKSCPAWVKAHPYVEVIYVKKDVDKTYETYATIKMMKRYGWQVVRGAGWTRVELASPPLELYN